MRRKERHSMVQSCFGKRAIRVLKFGSFRFRLALREFHVTMNWNNLCVHKYQLITIIWCPNAVVGKKKEDACGMTKKNKFFLPIIIIIILCYNVPRRVFETNVVLPNVCGIHENAGLLWKHMVEENNVANQNDSTDREYPFACTEAPKLSGPLRVRLSRFLTKVTIVSFLLVRITVKYLTNNECDSPINYHRFVGFLFYILLFCFFHLGTRKTTKILIPTNKNSIILFMMTESKILGRQTLAARGQICYKNEESRRRFDINPTHFFECNSRYQAWRHR